MACGHGSLEGAGVTAGNWGRWGADDERGALNLVDAAAVRRGLAAAGEGRVLGLAVPLRSQGLPLVERRPPFVHTMLVSGADYEAGARRGPDGFQFADDFLAMAVHSGTHLDALSHVARRGEMYNGVSAGLVRGAGGARRLGIEHFGGLVTRGVLLDVAGEEPVISARELEAALARTGADLLPGDAVFLHTGWLQAFQEGTATSDAERGIGVEAATWLASRDVVLVAADNFAVETVPYEGGGSAPAHIVLLQQHGIYILEMADVRPLIAAGITTFACVVAPLPISGGVGSPVNPLAIY